MQRVDGQSVFRVPVWLWGDPEFRLLWLSSFPEPCRMPRRISRSEWLELNARERAALQQRGWFSWSYHRKKWREAVIARDGLRCAACGVVREDGKYSPIFHLDHVIPICRGGVNALFNFQLLCESCNVRKGSQMPVPPEGMG